MIMSHPFKERGLNDRKQSGAREAAAAARASILRSPLAKDASAGNPRHTAALTRSSAASSSCHSNQHTPERLKWPARAHPCVICWWPAPFWRGQDDRLDRLRELLKDLFEGDLERNAAANAYEKRYFFKREISPETAEGTKHFDEQNTKERLLMSH
ncbi:Hypothetical predicted protein [Cloeon dipterum]|uniref:Uncharacterized protein n=1 Tax=Cloeon dipterum TaxID=197152 RepID=A0A8S1BPS8_9INSE|nr:Hypothetical predicted protein [Cloeon dipterum]